MPIIKQKEGADPAAVVYDGIQAARSRHADILIVDTAGRLHNKAHLMEELKKISRVAEREYPEAKVKALLVIDATTGQNGLQQALLFKEVANIEGIVLTKLDGTAKGGIAVAIRNELGLPGVLHRLWRAARRSAALRRQAVRGRHFRLERTKTLKRRAICSRGVLRVTKTPRPLCAGAGQGRSVPQMLLAWASRYFSASAFHRPLWRSPIRISIGKHRIGLALLGKVGDGDQRHVDLRVDQLLAALDLGRFSVVSTTAFRPPTWVIIAAGLILPEVIISMASFISLVLPPEVPTRCV